MVINIKLNAMLITEANFNITDLLKFNLFYCPVDNLLEYFLFT